MKKNSKKPILFLSYFYGVKGCCPAEWADDKIETLSDMGERIILISSLASKKCDKDNVVHFRLPSPSWTDFKYEYSEAKNNDVDISFLKLSLYFFLAFTVGNLMDLLQKIVVGGNGGGKWAWTIPCFLLSLPLSCIKRCNDIFSTGGPASSHLAGSFVRYITRKRLICELQDPLVGKEIGRNANSSRLLAIVEKIIVKLSDKVIYVTEVAAEEARERYPNLENKIYNIYPGSRQFNIKKESSTVINKKNITLIHLGTLYSSRNMNTIIKAIDELIDEEIIKEGQIKILNLGEIYGDIKEHHLSRSYITQEAILPREAAVTKANSEDVSLLIQHADERSQTTIPYKTYDYFNIGNPILGLTNSKELKKLLINSGNISVDIDDIPRIKESLIGLLFDYGKYKANCRNKGIDIKEQVKLLFSFEGKF